MEKSAGEYYLRNFLRIAPLSHALWRSVEALCFQDFNIKDPSLDLGCGFGEFSGAVYNRVTVGIDINAKDLLKASKKGLYKETRLADAHSLPFPDNYFSTVIAVSVLEHIKDPPKVLREVRRVLRKNGQFAFSVPTTSLNLNLLGYCFFKKLGFSGLALRYIDFHRYIFKHQSIHSSNWWEKQIKHSGLRIVRKTGTISPQLANLHEIFLLSAFPSQWWKVITGKRLIVFQIRARILPTLFRRFVRVDEQSEINMFYLVEKL